MREIPVRLKLDQIDPRVIPDLSASADVVLAVGEAGHAGAARCGISGRPGAKPFVFLRTSPGWQRREVELGLRSNVAAVVRSGLRRAKWWRSDAARQRQSLPRK